MYREVAQVLSEHADKAVEEYAKAAFSDVHKIPYGEHVMISLYTPAINRIVKARECIKQRGIALNAVAMDDDSKTPEFARWHCAVRFNHLGELSEWYQPKETELILMAFSVMQNYLWGDGATGRLKTMRSHCVSQRYEWEDQAKNGRVYAMMKLLEVDV